MVRKVKKKKSGMRIFVTFLLMVGIAAFVYITQGKYHIFEVPPLIEPDLSVEANPTSPTAALPGQFSVTFPDQGESAVGTDNFGVIASTPNQTPVPIASVTKIMTAYLVLKAHPLQAWRRWPHLNNERPRCL